MVDFVLAVWRYLFSHHLLYVVFLDAFLEWSNYFTGFWDDGCVYADVYDANLRPACPGVLTYDWFEFDRICSGCCCVFSQQKFTNRR